MQDKEEIKGWVNNGSEFLIHKKFRYEHAFKLLKQQ